jgi:hypothetical protein
MGWLAHLSCGPLIQPGIAAVRLIADASAKHPDARFVVKH